MNANISDGTHFQCSGTHKDLGLWVPRTHKGLNNFAYISNFQTQIKDSYLSGAFAVKLPQCECHRTPLIISQVMACCHQATSHYLNHCWPRSTLPYESPVHMNFKIQSFSYGNTSESAGHKFLANDAVVHPQARVLMQPSQATHHCSLDKQTW